MKIITEAGITTREKSFSPNDVYSAEEAFVTGTCAGVVPVHALLFGDAGLAAAYLDAAETLAATPQIVLPAAHDLLEVVASQDITSDTFVWAAGEAGALVPVRRHLKGGVGLPAENLSLHGYWKQGTQGLDHHAPLDADDPD